MLPGLERLEERTLLSAVVVFDNPSFVDTSGSSSAESDNVQASLSFLGHSVTTFTDITAAGVTSALVGKDVLVIPKQQIGNLAPALTAEAKTAITDFVSQGGQVVVHGGGSTASNTRGDDFLNGVFGFTVTETARVAGTYLQTADAVGTPFSDDAASIPWNNLTCVLTTSTLPAGAKSLYQENGTRTAVATFSYGAGQIAYLGWDWFNATPVGTADGGWLQVLDSAVQEAAVSNSPPVADAGGPYEVSEGGAVTLDASGTTDPDQPADGLNYLWDLDGDGQFGETGANAARGSERGVNPVYAAAGDGPSSVTVGLQVTDNGGLVSSDTATISIVNAPPVVTSLELDSTTVAENSTLVLTVNFADPGLVDTHTVVISWGDGSDDTLVSVPAGDRSIEVPHVYAQDGGSGASQIYTITAAVTDDDGDTGSGQVDVTVQNAPPLFTAFGLDHSEIDENGIVVLHGEFFDAGSEDTHSLTVNWGDGSPEEVVTLPIGARSFDLSHQYGSYDELGSLSDVFTISATVTDDDGGTDSDAVNVTVYNVTPVVTGLTLDATVIDEYGTVLLSGTFTDPSQLDLHEVTIHWGDGSNRSFIRVPIGERAFSATHQYTSNGPAGSPSGTFQIDVEVLDDDGALGTAQTAVVVNNVAPSVSSVSLNTVVDEDGTVSLSGTFADPGLLDAHVVSIDWGDGSAVQTLDLSAGERAFDLSHRYVDDNPSGTAADDYTISVSVTDSDGGVGAAQATVTVNNVAPVLDGLSLSATEIDAGGTVQVTGTFTDPGTADTHAAVIHWGDGSSDTIVAVSPGQRTFQASHQYLANGSSTPTAVYTIAATVSDDDGGSDSAQTSVTVNQDSSVDLTGLQLSSSHIRENRQVTLTGTFTDPALLNTHTVTVNWGDGSAPSVISLTDGERSFSVRHRYRDDSPSGTSSDQFTIQATVTNSGGSSSTAQTAIQVDNVAPVIGGFELSSNPVGSTRPGEVATLSAAFTDVGRLDTHTAVIDWGDGTVTPATITESNGTGTANGTHIYTKAGRYVVRLILNDDDLGTTSASAASHITGAAVHDGVLQIVGTTGNDNVKVHRQGNGVYRVEAAFLPGGSQVFDSNGIDRIDAILGRGKDTFKVTGNVNLPIAVDGGAGSDLAQQNGKGLPLFDDYTGGPWGKFVASVVANWKAGRK